MHHKLKDGYLENIKPGLNHWLSPIILNNIVRYAKNKFTIILLFMSLLGVKIKQFSK